MKCCKECRKTFEIKLSRKRDLERKFCSRSCSVTYNNRKNPKRIAKTKPPKKPRPRPTDNLIDDWLAGDNNVTMCSGEYKQVKPFVKRYLIETRGDCCENCGFNELAPDGRSIIQMNHIDGNHQNNLIENLELLCPNCHAMTSNYGSLNMGNGRSHRRKKR